MVILLRLFVFALVSLAFFVLALGIKVLINIISDRRERPYNRELFEDEIDRLAEKIKNR